MTAPCGIDCDDCEIHVAACDREAAEKLASVWRANGIAAAEPGWFRCRGCRGDRSVCWTDDCAIYRCCVEERRLDNCSVCADFACTTLEAWAAQSPHHAAALKRLKALRV